jgi:hypothetical protein
MQFHCPLDAPEKCELNPPSLEISGDSGIVQQTCRACGHGCSLRLPLDQAQELLAAMHEHREPPEPPAAAKDQTADSPGKQPSGKLG